MDRSGLRTVGNPLFSVAVSPRSCFCPVSGGWEEEGSPHLCLTYLETSLSNRNSLFLSAPVLSNLSFNWEVEGRAHIFVYVLQTLIVLTEF